MVVEPAVSLINGTVKYSWLVSAVAVKYILAAYVVKLGYEGSLDLQSFQDTVLKFARPTVTGIVALGFILSLTRISFSPVLQIFSELVALGYFGFLFWKY